MLIFAFDATREISTILILMTHMALYFQNLKQMLNTNVEIIGKIDRAVLAKLHYQNKLLGPDTRHYYN